MRSILPMTPTNGQIFIDSEMVKWIYNADLDLWERAGTSTGIPLADDTIDGYMSYKDKNLLDSIPPVPGGFGIITDTKLLLQSDTNPEGMISGDIELRSESLDIKCVDVSDLEITYTPTSSGCPSVSTAQQHPGLLFKLSDKFLKSLLVNFPGNTGKKGKVGEKGLAGRPGWAGGPAGLQGLPGVSVDELASLESIEYNDLDGVTDTAIVGLQLADTGSGCKLVLDKSKLNISTIAPADKVIAIPAVRNVTFPASANCPTGMKGWSINKGSADDAPVNLSLVRLPKGAGEDSNSSVGFNAAYSLSNLISEVVAEYEKLLTKIDGIFGKEAKEFVTQVDSKARGILSGLASDLASCEFNLPAVEYCITFTGCDQPPATPPAPPPPPPPPPPATMAWGVNTVPSNLDTFKEGDIVTMQVLVSDPTYVAEVGWNIALPEGSTPNLSPATCLDLDPCSGLVKIKDGQGTFSFKIADDGLSEEDEYFRIVINNDKAITQNIKITASRGLL